MCPVLALGETGKGFGKICPRDGRPNCSIVDALPPEHHSPTTHFVSWCWHYTLEVVVSGVWLWAQSSSLQTAEVFLWMCFFCNNQYRIQDGSCSNSDDLSAVFESRLSSARNMLVILDTFLTPHYYKRAWCLFETFICLKKHFPMTVILPPKELTTFKQVLETSPWRVRDSFLQIDLQNAEASVEADALAIKDLVRSSFGFDVVNTMVKEEFMSWLMRAFQEYVKGTIHADDQNVWTI
ncbi:rngB [Symbiodinium pilosum]|uniref:RngB protein n=1 Tax=Symbiodinium pilosum TaxID=2952 RepID=A0A812L943_SYMPI|nr:rngB [Symbiodinium pilosum]